jgi:hypothetical protein
MVGSPVRPRSRVLDLPRAPGTKSTVAGPAQHTAADMAVTVSSVKDVIQSITIVAHEQLQLPSSLHLALTKSGGGVGPIDRYASRRVFSLLCATRAYDFVHTQGDGLVDHVVRNVVRPYNEINVAVRFACRASLRRE